MTTYSTPSKTPDEVFALAEAVKEQRRRRDAPTWIEANYYVKETNALIELEPYQRAVLRKALERRDDGTFKYQTIVWSQPKKSGKTAIAGAIARWAAETWGPFQSIFCVGNDAKQAEERAFASVRESIELTTGYDARRDTLPNRWHLLTKVMTSLANGSKIEAIACDYKGEAGGNPSLTVWTELWGYTNRDALKFWAEMAPSPTRRNSVRWIETYAGYEGESELLWGLYDATVLSGRQLVAGELGDLGCFEDAPNPDSPVPCYVDDQAGIFAFWDSGTVARRMPWQQGERGARYYASEAKTQTPKQMDRLHSNLWQSTETAFVPMELWDACKAPLPLAPGDKTPLVVALDAAVTGDCFALVGVSRHPRAWETDIAVRLTHVWKPDGKPLDYDKVRDVCVTLFAEFNVVQFAYDPYQLHNFAMQRTKAGTGWWREFSQGADRLEADKTLYDLVMHRSLSHDGDFDLREHVGNSNAKQAAHEDSKLRIVKKSQSRPIDLCVALSMAAFECLRLNLSAPR